jgi:hypothetical protein
MIISLWLLHITGNLQSFSHGWSVTKQTLLDQDWFQEQLAM